MRNVEASLIVDYDGPGEAVVKTLVSTSDLEVNSGYTMMPCFYEEGIYEMLLISKGSNPLTIYHESCEINSCFTTAESITFGAFSFDGEIGYSTFQIISGGRIVLSFNKHVGMPPC